MTPEKLQYCYALANDLEIRGEVASANFVRNVMREREDLLNACKVAQQALRATSQADKDYSHECGLLRDAISKAER